MNEGAPISKPLKELRETPFKLSELKKWIEDYGLPIGIGKENITDLSFKIDGDNLTITPFYEHKN